MAEKIQSIVMEEINNDGDTIMKIRRSEENRRENISSANENGEAAEENGSIMKTQSMAARKAWRHHNTGEKIAMRKYGGSVAKKAALRKTEENGLKIAKKPSAKAGNMKAAENEELMKKKKKKKESSKKRKTLKI
jgi:hypothetical protein